MWVVPYLAITPEILWPSQDSTGIYKPHHPTLQTYDTLTIPGQHMDGHCTPPPPPVRVSRDPEILWPSQDSTWMGTRILHHLPHQSIPRSRDTLDSTWMGTCTPSSPPHSWHGTGPAATVRLVWLWPYRFLREKIWKQNILIYNHCSSPLLKCVFSCTHCNVKRDWERNRVNYRD